MALQETLSTSFIYSDLAEEDPTFAEIVDIFVHGLPRRLEDMQQSLSQRDYDALRRQAHQLKGSGGGHGYPILSEQAAALEKLVLNQALSDIQKQIDEITELITRIRVAPPTP